MAAVWSEAARAVPEWGQWLDRILPNHHVPALDLNQVIQLCHDKKIPASTLLLDMVRLPQLHVYVPPILAAERTRGANVLILQLLAGFDDFLLAGDDDCYVIIHRLIDHHLVHCHFTCLLKEWIQWVLWNRPEDDHVTDSTHRMVMRMIGQVDL